MRTILLICFVLTNLITVFSQDIENVEVIRLNDFFKGEGVILKNKYLPPFELLDFKSHYIPTFTDIKNVEYIVKEQWNKLSFDKKYFNYKKLRYWNRQYFCYITKSNEIVVIVMFLNFKNKRKAKKYFPNWKSELIIGFGSFYELNTLMLKINISKRKITI